MEAKAGAAISHRGKCEGINLTESAHQDISLPLTGGE